jgi:hypothetical protein
VCKLRWNQVVSGPRVLATMEPSFTWSSRSVPWVQVPYVLALRTLGLKSMAQVHKSSSVSLLSPLRWQLYLGSEIHCSSTYAHFGGTSRRKRSHPSPLRWHKTTSVAILSPLRRQNYSFSLIFYSLWLSRKCFSFFAS